MTNAFRLVGAALAVGVMVWVYGLLFQGPEEEIRGRLDALAEAASVTPGETNLERMSRAVRLGRFVTEDVVVAARAPVGVDGVGFEFLNARIVLASDAGSASVNVTVRGTGVDLVTGDVRVDAIELDMRWREVDDEWLVASVTEAESLPPGRPRRRASLDRATGVWVEWRVGSAASDGRNA